jgi:hypothetical protein
VAPAAPSPAAIRQQIIDAVLAYGRALESRNISQIRLAYPGLTSAQEQGWRGFFQEAQNVRVSLGVTEVQQSGDAAEVTVNGTLEYTQSRRAKRDPMPFRATLERGAGGWRITVIR